MSYNIISENNLLVGDFKTAQDLDLLQKLGVTHIVSCGFREAFFKGEFKYYFVDIIDVPAANLLQYLPPVTTFIKRALVEEKGVVYVHCVHGQSRSCAVCVAFLMAYHYWPSSELNNLRFKPPKNFRNLDHPTGKENMLHVCYNIVKLARPCMAINPGFLQQLEIFRRMKTVKKRHMRSNSCLSSTVHATYRTHRAQGEYYAYGRVTKFCVVDTSTADKYCMKCTKCSEALLTDQNLMLGHFAADEISEMPISDYWNESLGGKQYAQSREFSEKLDQPNILHERLLDYPKNIFKVEPMEWMRKDMMIKTNNIETGVKDRGILHCPKCGQELGRWDWCYRDIISSVLILKHKVVVRETKNVLP